MSIKVSQLTKLYGSQRAIDNISFDIPSGQIVGFLGPNGAGKSTTMKILTGYLAADSGSASINELSVEDNAMEVRKMVGYLPENNPLYLDLYVAEYLSFVGNIYGLGAKTKARVEEMIALTGLTAERKKKIGQLSKGYKQRIGLAQALIHDPKVLILDEPTSGLDPNQLVDIRNLIIRIGKEKTVLLSTHIMQEVQAMCDRAIIIKGGKIVADDKISNLTSQDNKRLLIELEFLESVPAAMLQALQGVIEVHALKGFSWKLITENKEEIRKQLFDFAKENNFTLVKIQQQESTMEEVFKDLTNEANKQNKKK
jgi:ABC-2 type transport system ATP-binding protein